MHPSVHSCITFAVNNHMGFVTRRRKGHSIYSSYYAYYALCPSLHDPSCLPVSCRLKNLLAFLITQVSWQQVLLFLFFEYVHVLLLLLKEGLHGNIISGFCIKSIVLISLASIVFEEHSSSQSFSPLWNFPGFFQDLFSVFCLCV